MVICIHTDTDYVAVESGWLVGAGGVPPHNTTVSYREHGIKRKPPPFFTGFILFYFSYSTGLFEGNVHNCTFKTLVPHAATLDTSSRNFGISHREKTELR